MDQLLGLFPGHGRAHKHAAVHRGVDSLRFKQGLQGVILPVGVRGPALQGPHLDHAAHAAAAIDHKLSWLKHFRYLLVPWGGHLPGRYGRSPAAGAAPGAILKFLFL